MTANAARRAARLVDQAEEILAVQASWRLFSVHALACDACRPARRACLKEGLRSDDDRLDGHMAQMHAGLCAEGRPLFEAWRYAVRLLVESLRR